MPEHQTHKSHDHHHAPGCGHKAVTHGDHKDYLHDGHLHAPHGDHVDECAIKVDAAHPADCTPSHACGGHVDKHVHGTACGHEAVPHGDHVDYVVGDHLHHPHAQHCDHHGAIALA